jgi:cysteine synthase A
MQIYDNILELIGKTPLVRLNKITEGCLAQVVAKVESFNPACSVKDRISLGMILDAERKGLIAPGRSTIIEPTSGNTGIGLAMVCTVKGYRLIITMPESMSKERRQMITAYGAELILTDAALGMAGAINKASELLEKIPYSFMPQQFSNPANPQTHMETTAEEIWNDTDGQVDIIVSGIGTGGTATGIARALKSRKDIKIIAVEPSESAVLSGKPKGVHGIQGIGAGFVPEIVDLSLFDEIITVDTQSAMATAREAGIKEGILCGISCGAALNAALTVAKREENKGKLVVVIKPDYGERYLSTDLYKEQFLCL